jgi:hypothetical protein
MKIVYATALCAALVLGAGAASAEDANLYANLGYGSLHGGQITTGEITGRIGARFGDYFGVEGELSTGLGSHEYTYGPHCSGPICPFAFFIALLKARMEHAESAYAVGFLPILPNADLFARVGYGTSHYKTAGIIGQDFDPQGMSIGAGAQYFIDGANGLRFDYTHDDLHSNNAFGREALGNSADVWSVAYTREF